VLSLEPSHSSSRYILVIDVAVEVKDAQSVVEGASLVATIECLEFMLGSVKFWTFLADNRAWLMRRRRKSKDSQKDQSEPVYCI